MPLIPGYPQSEGAKVVSVITKAGPASYAQLSNATPPTGGQVVSAVEFGLKYIEYLDVSVSDNGQYSAFATPGTSEALACDTWRLAWFTRATGAEVAATTDLSGRTVRLRAVGLA